MEDELKKHCLIRVVDDDPAMLRSWRFLLESEGWNVSCYSSATEFLGKDNNRVPGCIVLDVRMPQMSGIELQRELTLRGDLLPIVFVSAHGDIDMAVQALKDGAVDFLPKPVRAERLLGAIERAVTQDLTRREEQSANSSMQRAFDSLTRREKMIAQKVSEGYTNKRIARELDISEKTVQAHRTSVSRKLGVKGAAEITRILMSVEFKEDGE